MEQYKQEFIEFMVDSEVLKFGEFTLKSGRKSPFFTEMIINEVMKPAAQWYCEYAKWEDENIRKEGWK